MESDYCNGHPGLGDYTKLTVEEYDKPCCRGVGSITRRIEVCGWCDLPFQRVDDLDLFMVLSSSSDHRATT